MKRSLFVWTVLGGLFFFSSCKNEAKIDSGGNAMAENRIMQQEDGSIALEIDKAECYHDLVNPSSNTAEWDVVITRSGRFNIWLSSATKDTTDLKFENSVLLSIRDKRIESRPSIDRVIYNSGDVAKPYFRTDSFMGSLYIQDTGIYNVQVISDRILPEDYAATASTTDDQTKILSLVLTPENHDSVR